MTITPKPACSPTSTRRRMPDIFYTVPSTPTCQLRYTPHPHAKPKSVHTVMITHPTDREDRRAEIPIVVTLHGGARKSAYNYRQMAYINDALVAHGALTCNVEYTRVGHAQGGRPQTFVDLIVAANAISDYLDEHKIQKNNITLVGHSSGAHLAFWLAAANRLRGAHHALGEIIDHCHLPVAKLISLAGVIDLQAVRNADILHNEIIGLLNEQRDDGNIPSLSHRASAAEALPLGIPQLLLHGTRDRLVPMKLSEQYCQRAVAAGDACTFISIDTCAHFRMIDPSSHFWEEQIGPAVYDFIGC